jgi:hypothetical protein
VDEDVSQRHPSRGGRPAGNAPLASRYGRLQCASSAASMAPDTPLTPGAAVGAVGAMALVDLGPAMYLQRMAGVSIIGRVALADRPGLPPERGQGCVVGSLPEAAVLIFIEKCSFIAAGLANASKSPLHVLYLFPLLRPPPLSTSSPSPSPSTSTSSTSTYLSTSSSFTLVLSFLLMAIP